MSYITDPYLWPGSTVLRNNFGITNADELALAERRLAAQRQAEGCPSGTFDRTHLEAIHQHLFQDIYDWAGQTRTLNISKGVSQFIDHRYIDTGLADIHRRIEQAGYLRGLDPDQFATQAGTIVGDVNHVHPFREGNGRTQLEYLRQLGAQAGHTIDLARFDRDRWIEASILANAGSYAPMADEIRAAIQPDTQREQEKAQDRAAELAQLEAKARELSEAMRQRDLARSRDRNRDRDR